MAKTVAVGDKLYKYYIENSQIKVVEGIIDERKGKKYVIFDTETMPDEGFPGYRNIERVWKGGEILWLTDRDDEFAKQLFTKYHVEVIKELQKQIDDVGDRISMIRTVKVKAENRRIQRANCFGNVTATSSESSVDTSMTEGKRQYQENWDASTFVDPAQYVERKIVMLQKEMCIELSSEDICHLKSLTSRVSIDAAVRAIINKYWE